MQIHADGGADYTAVKLGGGLRHFSRWITRTKNHSACSVCAPVSCCGNGYTIEKRVGRVIEMDPGEEIALEVRVGYLRPADAAAMEQKIAALVQKKENE